MAQVSSRYSDHFAHVCCVVAFQIRFRYVFEFSFMNGSSFKLLQAIEREEKLNIAASKIDIYSHK